MMLNGQSDMSDENNIHRILLLDRGEIRWRSSVARLVAVRSCFARKQLRVCLSDNSLRDTRLLRTTTSSKPLEGASCELARRRRLSSIWVRYNRLLYRPILRVEMYHRHFSKAGVPYCGEFVMKLVVEFTKFLEDEVNLNKTRIGTLTDRVDAIQKFLSNSGWQAPIDRYSPQGSWAHKTIIRPPGDQGFDADVLVFVQHVAGWKAEDYVLTLKDKFKGSGTYKEKVGLHTRCVRLEYSR